MAVFDKIFNITDVAHIEKINSTQIDVVAFDKDAVKTLRDGMQKDGIHVDGNDAFFNAGALALIFNTKNKEGGHIPEAVTRIESLGEVAQNPAILQPAFGKAYADNQYYAYIVPRADDIPHPDKLQPEDPQQQIKVTQEDIVRTFRVLKASGLDQHLVDMIPTAFVFLKNENGEVMRYPANASDPDFKNQPIAFLRDLNACPASAETANSLKGLSNAIDVLKEWKVNVDALTAAPQDCIDACKQQYALTAKLAEALSRNGITPNIPVPAPPSQQADVKVVEVGAAEKVLHGKS